MALFFVIIRHFCKMSHFRQISARNQRECGESARALSISGGGGSSGMFSGIVLLGGIPAGQWHECTPEECDPEPALRIAGSAIDGHVPPERGFRRMANPGGPGFPPCGCGRKHCWPGRNRFPARRQLLDRSTGWPGVLFRTSEFQVAGESSGRCNPAAVFPSCPSRADAPAKYLTFASVNGCKARVVGLRPPRSYGLPATKWRAGFRLV